MESDNYIFTIHVCPLRTKQPAIAASLAPTAEMEATIVPPAAAKEELVEVGEALTTTMTQSDVTCMMTSKADNSTMICGRDKVKFNAKGTMLDLTLSP